MKSPSNGNTPTTPGEPSPTLIEQESAIDFATLDRLVEEPVKNRPPTPRGARLPSTPASASGVAPNVLRQAQPVSAGTAPNVLRQPQPVSAGTAPPFTFVASGPPAVAQPVAKGGIFRHRASRHRSTVSRIAIVLLVLVAIGQAVAIAMLLQRQLVASAPGEGSLAIRTVPAGARVIVGETDRGATPLTLSLPAGTHRATLALGTERRAFSVDVAAGGTYVHHVEFAVSEAAAPAGTGGTTGALEIRTRPAGAAVLIAGTARGKTPVTVTDLAPGTHEVLLNLGGQQFKETVTVQAGVTAKLSAAFPSTSANRASGWIAVSSPVELTILEGGQVLGTTRSPRIMVPAGRHSLELVNERLGFRTTRVVEVDDGKTAAFTPELPKGSVSVNALPWAEVWVEERKVGDTPLANLSLPIGNHQLTFRHPSLGERRQDVTITAGAATRVSVDMRR